MTGGWAFGVGQSFEEHLAEEVAAHAAGSIEEWRRGHDEVHGGVFAEPRGTSNERTSSRTRRTPEEVSALFENGRVRGFDFADPEEVGELLEMADAGTISFEPARLPPLPANASSAMVDVAGFAAKLLGLRERVMGPGPVMLAVRFVGAHTGLPKSTVARVLRDLAAAGVLVACEAREPMPGRARGTAVYAAGSVVAERGGERAEVHGDASLDGTKDVGVDGAAEVGGLVPIDASGGLDVVGPPAADDVEVATVGESLGGGADGQVVAHDSRGYEPPLTADRLLEMAVQSANVGTRNSTGFWLACQLRDLRLPIDVARDTMGDYAARVPQIGHDYAMREALASLQQAYSRDPRAPWGEAAAPTAAVLR